MFNKLLYYENLLEAKILQNNEFFYDATDEMY